MWPFKPVAKRSKRISGTRVTVILTERGLDSVITTLKSQSVDRWGGRRFPVQKSAWSGLDKFSNSDIMSAVEEGVFEGCFLAAAEIIRYVPYPTLFFHIRIQEVERGQAQFHPDLSRGNIIVCSVESECAVSDACRRLKHEDTDAGAFIIDRKTRPLHEVLTHEFAHSLDNTKTNDLFKASARLLALTRDTEELYDYGLFWYIGKLRIEGPATFFQTRSHKFIVYDSSFVNSARMAITQYNGVKGISMETPYLSGSYMCYTIGLAYMKERRRDEFDSMIARIGSTELTFRNGMDRIIPLKGKVELQNLPVEVIDMVFAKVKELSHLGFLKEYENACRIVDIPPEQIIITFSEYSRLKRIAYDYWKTLMQEKGFE